MRFEAVIFDFDGVIGDTMKDNCVAWQKAFAAYGFDMDPSEYYQLEGMGRFQIADHFISAYQLDPATRQDVVEAKELNYKHNNTFRIYEQVPDIFDLLKQQEIPVAIVTGASRNRMEEHLQGALRQQVSVLITADDVTNTKPHPEPYLNAVAQLGKVPGKCLVIENAILGIRSAKAAGCECYALETTLDKKYLMQADAVFSSHKDLLAALKKRLH